MRDTIDMAREAGFETMRGHGLLPHVPEDIFIANACVTKEVNRLVALVRAEEREEANRRANASWTLMCEKMVAAEREACAKKTEEFARKWWKIHCDSNLHYSSTLKAHQDFCALQAAIRARGNT
jgi:hypothetical protein